MSLQNLFKRTTTSIIEEKEKTYVNVHYSEKDKAKKFGAKWDRKESQWYIEGDVEEFYDKFTGTCKLQRDIWKIQRKIKDYYGAIEQRNNADITFPNPEMDAADREEIKILEKELRKLIANKNNNNK